MQYSEIMVRYGELSTKGKNRQAFIGRLNGNVTRALHEFPTSPFGLNVIGCTLN